MAGLGRTIANLARHRRSASGAAPRDPGRLREVTGFGPNPGNLRMLAHVPAHLAPRAGLVVVLNKWDVAENASGLFNGVKAALEEGLSQVKGLPVLTVSAVTGKGIDTMLKVAFETRDAWSRRVGTGELNRWFEAAIEKNPPPAPGGKRIKPRYITQAKTRPPGFVLFGTRVDLLPESYRRYLVNGIRRDLGFGAVPVRLTLRAPKNPFDREKS